MNETTTQGKRDDSHGGPGGHVVSSGTLLRTFGALAVLTALTITISRFDFGQWNVIAALAIACTKGALVAAFFMHLRYEGRFNLVILLSSLFFAVVLVGFVLMDTRTYQPDIRHYGADHPAASERGHAPHPQAVETP